MGSVSRGDKGVTTMDESRDGGGGTKRQKQALTTTWLQRTSELFSHTASKLSSNPKLHWREVPCRHRTKEPS